jgi:hypothetical protein
MPAVLARPALDTTTENAAALLEAYGRAVFDALFRAEIVLSLERARTATRGPSTSRAR